MFKTVFSKGYVVFPLVAALALALTVMACDSSQTVNGGDQDGENSGISCLDDNDCPIGQCCGANRYCGVCGGLDGDLTDTDPDDTVTDQEPDLYEGQCARDSDCNDGLFCNGVEMCVSGRCQAGQAPSCDDSIACTTDLCS